MRKKKLIAVVFVLAFLVFELSLKLGYLGYFMAKPGDLNLESSVSETPNGSVFVIGWDIELKALDRIVNGNDIVLVFYPSGVRVSDEFWPLFKGFPKLNLTVRTGKGDEVPGRVGYNVWYYPTPGFATPKVELIRAVYVASDDVDGGRIELPLIPANISKCSTIPVIFAYFHDIGGGDVDPGYVELRPKLRFGPGYPVFGNESLEFFFEFNFSAWIDSTGGWVEVRVFNVTLPCEGG